MLNEVENSWYKETFYFMCLTGVRVGELGGLKWSNIDFDKKVICINRLLSYSYCDGEKREILVSSKTVNSVRQMREKEAMTEVKKNRKPKKLS